MAENPYQSPAPQSADVSPQATRQRSRFTWIAYGLLLLGMIILAQGAAAFFLGIRFFLGIGNGSGLTSVYHILAGVGICVVGLAFKTLADRQNQKRRPVAPGRQPTR